MKSTEPTYKGLRWQVTISILLFWLCHSVSGQIHYSIVEEMRKDSVIANIGDDLGLDIKQLSSRKLRIVSRASERFFYVNKDNGNLYIKDRIDRETLCGTEDSCFLTFDAVVENPLTVFRIKVEIQDVNDNSPVFVPDVFTVETIELTSPTTRFALQNAEDPDTGSNSIQSYKLSDNQYFTLSEGSNTDGSTFLELVLEKPLDRETQSLHELILTAMDGGNPLRSGTALIRIIVTDANDNFPIFTQQVYKVQVNEDIPVNTTIITIGANDKDEGLYSEIAYSFSKTSGNVHYSGTFSIHPVIGEIKTIDRLDFELVRNYELSLQAKDGGGLVAHCKVLIEVLDANDNPPEISIMSLSTAIPEDAAPGTVVALIEVHDQDSGENGEVDCKLIGELSFNLVLSDDSYYRIITASGMDREQMASYNISIIANDRGSPSLFSKRTVTLEISDVNDNPPMFLKSKFVTYVPENNLPGASIYTLQATDPDTGDNAKITYTVSAISTEDLPLSSYLSINIESGVIYAQRTFDYEQLKEFVIQVTARDNGSPTLSSNATLLIHIVDQNDNVPKILYPSTDSGGSAVFEMVPFVSEPGSLITKVVAVDADSGHNSWLSYYFIQASEPSHYFINEHTGEIRSAHVFQEKDILKHKVVVVVKDNGDPAFSATVTLSLIVADNFQQVVPKLNPFSDIGDVSPQNSLQLYLLIALALISFLFIITLMLVIILKCKKSKPSTTFGSFSTNLYPAVDPRVLSMYSDGTLPLPYSYNLCVALDPSESDFDVNQSNQNVPVDNLIDADDSGHASEALKEALMRSSDRQVSL